MIKIIHKENIEEKFYHKFFKNKNMELINKIINNDGNFFLGINNKSLDYYNNSLIITGGMGSGKGMLIRSIISFFKLKQPDSEIYVMEGYYHADSDYLFLKNNNYIKKIELNKIEEMIDKIYAEYKLRINFIDKVKLKPIVIYVSQYDYIVQNLLAKTLMKIKEMFMNSSNEKIYFILENENSNFKKFNDNLYKNFEIIKMKKRSYGNKDKFCYNSIKEKKQYQPVPYITNKAWEYIFQKKYIAKNEKIMLIHDNANLILNLIDNDNPLI